MRYLKIAKNKRGKFVLQTQVHLCPILSLLTEYFC